MTTTTTTTTTPPWRGYGGSTGESIENSDNNGWGAIVMFLIAAPIALIGSWPLMFKRKWGRGT